MKEGEKIKTFLDKHNGYITSGEIESLGIRRNNIVKFVNEGLLRKVSFGLYIDNSLMEDEYYILQKRYPSAVFCSNTAFHILNLTNRVPYKIDITVPKDKKVRGNYNVHRISYKYYDLGIIEVKSFFGNNIKVYNAERSICDMLRYNDVDLEVQNRILDTYFQSDNKNIDLLLEYAKVFNIYDKVNTIVEVMMKW